VSCVGAKAYKSARIASQTFAHLWHSSPRKTDYIFMYAKAISSRDKVYSYLYSLFIFIVWLFLFYSLLILSLILWQVLSSWKINRNIDYRSSLSSILIWSMLDCNHPRPFSSAVLSIQVLRVAPPAETFLSRGFSTSRTYRTFLSRPVSGLRKGYRLESDNGTSGDKRMH